MDTGTIYGITSTGVMAVLLLATWAWSRTWKPGVDIPFRPDDEPPTPWKGTVIAFSEGRRIVVELDSGEWIIVPLSGPFWDAIKTNMKIQGITERGVPLMQGRSVEHG